MKKRNFVYLLALIFTLTLGVTALAQDDGPPSTPATETSLALEAVENVSTNSEFTVTATLTRDDTGEPLEGKNIVFSFGKDTDGDDVLEEVYLGPTDGVATDSEGYAEYTFSGYSEKGSYHYRAYFEGDGDFVYSAKTAPVEITTGAEVRTVSSSKNDRSGCRVKGRHSLTEFGQSSHSGPKRKSCVFIHTPNRARR